MATVMIFELTSERYVTISKIAIMEVSKPVCTVTRIHVLSTVEKLLKKSTHS